MLSLACRVIFNALVLMFILPAVTSITMTGAFWPEAVVAGFIFAIVAHVINWLIKVFVFGTLGLGGILVFFFWWLIPAIQLLAMSSWFPQYLTVPGWGTAILGGFVFMIVNTVINKFVESEKSSS